jgi:hypothetical protein
VESFQQIYFRQQPLLLNRFDAMIATAYARAAQADSARAILGRLASAGDADALDWMRASGYAALGEDVNAIGLLRAYLDRSPVVGLRVARGRPFWRLKGNVEYEQLVGR